MEGFINFLKPPGMTSHDAVGLVRRVLHEKHVGHAGTLDPGAAGVLPIAVGKSARLIEYLDNVSKSYRAEMLLGVETDSGDDTGKVTERLDSFEMPDLNQVEKVFEEFTGNIIQVPPAHSAIKINGRRACDLIRQGIHVEIPSREVEIHSIRFIERDEEKKTLLFDVDCSKGTYIRSLCQDMGHAMGIPSTMSFLVRTAVGNFRLSDAVSVEELQELGEKALLNPEKYIGHIRRYNLNPKRRKAFCNGLSSDDRAFGETIDHQDNVTLRVYAGDEFLGIGHYDKKNKTIVPDKVLAENG
ncbi:tRNA pseudouridine(55) synthase TruB [Anaerovibrio sp. RM50]|uniref:tRNA pseudouridine(55) synthase TruB n=1 Tax=Anaerovibrio sp. RM50 TaxID=1200557 RepID=UPI000481B5E4|nr:tRNA pseudouridine(55) synthase TruB [Anaerovibrio sp. RM50]